MVTNLSFWSTYALMPWQLMTLTTIIKTIVYMAERKTIKSVKQTAHVHCSCAAYNTSPASVSGRPEKLAEIETKRRQHRRDETRRDESKTAHHNAATTYNIQPNSKFNGPATTTILGKQFTQ